MGLKNQYPVKLGAPRALEDENTPIDSEVQDSSSRKR